MMPDASNRGEEDRRLAAQLRGKASDGNPIESIRQSYYLVGHQEPARQAELERMLREAREILICGIASRTLVLALHGVADNVRRGGMDFPWDSLHYVTPLPSMVL